MGKNKHNKLKYLVLDLDHTLIHCRKKKLSSTRKIHDIIPRPFLFDFLTILNNYYILNIFTAGNSEYCKMVLNKIQNKNYSFYKKLSSESLNQGKKN